MGSELGTGGHESLAGLVVLELLEVVDELLTYADAAEWNKKATMLAEKFINNFKKFENNEAGKALVAAGPQL